LCIEWPHLRLKDFGAFGQPLVNRWPIHPVRHIKVTFGYPDATNSPTPRSHHEI
jgi:hypothetical protein